MIVGILDYYGRKCLFKLENFKLNIEVIDNEVQSSVFILSSGSEKEFPEYLTGLDTESNKRITFKIRSMSRVSRSTYFAYVDYYVIFVGVDADFDGVRLNSDELNWFHKVSKAYVIGSTDGSSTNKVELESFEKTGKMFSFNLEVKK